MIKDEVVAKLKNITDDKYLEVTTRGNTAISAALSLVDSSKKVLIPAEAGWLTYKTIPKKLGLEIVEVKCRDAVLDLIDLEEKLKQGVYGALLYQNPAGYYAQQPMKDIFSLCRKYNCLVVLDVSGAIGTALCDHTFADVMVCSFGTWKLVEAHGGGFISTSDSKLWERLREKGIELLQDDEQMKVIFEQLNLLDSRITWLLAQRDQIVHDLRGMELGENILHAQDIGFVVVVRFETEYEKVKVIDYCKDKGWEWTECPRYIRLNDKAISIEIKRVVEDKK